MRSSGLSLDQAPPEHIPFRFFSTAPFFGMLAGGFILHRGELLFQNSWNFETIALTHLMTLGWLMMIMMGALYQMVPVLVGGHVPWIHLSLWVHGFLTFGILALITGFLHVSSLSFSLATLSLFLAFLIFLMQLLTALFRAEGKRPVVVAMRISVLCLTLAVSLGIWEAGTFAGLWQGSIDRHILKSLHVTYALTGAVGALIVGVGFHVIPMFYLSAVFPEERARWVIRLGVLSLILILFSLFFKLPLIVLGVSILPGLISSILYGITIWLMLSQRKRKIIDPTLRFWQMGLPAFPLALLSICAHLLWPDERWLVAFGMLFILGFAVNITNGMLYKIVPFLIWFHRFSSLVGIVKVPLLKNILPEKQANHQMKLSAGTMLILLFGVLIQQDVLIRFGGALWILNSCWLSWNLFTAFRMKPDLPENAQVPPSFSVQK